MISTHTNKTGGPSTDATHEAATPPILTVALEQLEDLRASVQTIAAIDTEFRAALVQNPRETIAALIAMNSGGAYELPKGLDVVVLEETPGATFVVVPSPDKVEGSQSELARLSREVASDPQLREALKLSPAETLQEQVDENGEPLIMIPPDHVIKIFCEDAGEILFVVPQALGPSGLSVATAELLSPSDPSMETWATWVCAGSAGTCQCTQQCNGSNGCTWWNNC